MPFLRIHNLTKNNNKNSIAISLRTLLHVLYQNVPLKRVSSFASRKLKASMAVEAAFVLPLFLFFLLNVISIMDMIGMQSRFSAALHQVGNRMAFAGYAYERTAGEFLPDGAASIILTEAYARSQILDYLGKENLNRSCVKNGTAGVRFDGTSIMGTDDMIEIHLSYRLEPLIAIPGLDGIAAGSCYYGHAWTGYDVEGGISGMAQDDPMVYVTETGSVYHTNRNCTYLKLSIETIDAASLEEWRNQSGGKYYACKICGSVSACGVVYITAQGSSYHSSITCPGLKRTIYTIPLSQAGGRGKCSKCR